MEARRRYGRPWLVRSPLDQNPPWRVQPRPAPYTLSAPSPAVWMNLKSTASRPHQIPSSALLRPSAYLGDSNPLIR